MVNNAAIQRVGDIELTSLELMKRVADVNFYGMVRVTKAFLPMIRKSKGMDWRVGVLVWHGPNSER